MFTPDPAPSPNNKPASKTFQCTTDKPCRAEVFIQRKLSCEPCSQSTMTGSSCDVDSSKPALMSSDFAKTPLKDGNIQHIPGPEDSLGFLAKKSDDVIISTCGPSMVHYKCREKSAVSDSFKSEGVKGNDEVSGNSLRLWSCDKNPETITTKIGKGGRNYQSHLFTPDKSVETSTLWSSGFKQAPFLSAQKTAINDTMKSTVFLPPEETTAERTRHVSKTYQSSLFY